jgi:hypothetical protein
MRWIQLELDSHPASPGSRSPDLNPERGLQPIPEWDRGLRVQADPHSPGGESIKKDGTERIRNIFWR